ncbi:hypothetical protein CIW52_06225 [Mycolicibacterium sp. P9-64]|uniref:hypothetical protein n=1 Tax=Mycolicibacterium sp. P9-64 TaxID=2024612 RepID=UPI0011ECDC70|nr:hypothetical protein [Mycolicibacterium sp. P9-64]KAA0085498.1 hypothetical protein CIW52_06225 [Mycolicibacterium sp. P9-64]
MRTRVLVAWASIALAAGITACERTTPGTVAMTTEPGASLSTSRTTSRPTMPTLPGIPGIPGLPSTPRTSSNVPPPPNSLTMKCEEYNKLDADTQLAVIQKIVSQDGSVIGQQNIEIAKTLADAMCQFIPSSTVNDLLLGGSPP